MDGEQPFRDEFGRNVTEVEPSRDDLRSGQGPRERSEARSVGELVRRLSVFRPPSLRNASTASNSVAGSLHTPKQSNNDNSVFDDDHGDVFSESSVQDDTLDNTKSFFPSVAHSPSSPTATSLVRKRSVFFVHETDSEEQTPQLADLQFSDEEQSKQIQIVEHFDEVALEELGRAANEWVFDEWLDLGEQTTIADRIDAAARDNSDNPYHHHASIRHSTDESMMQHFSSRRVDRQVVGTGFGEEAVKSIVHGIYDPSSVLSSLIEGFLRDMDEGTYQDACLIAVERPEEEAEAAVGVAGAAAPSASTTLPLPSWSSDPVIRASEGLGASVTAASVKDFNETSAGSLSRPPLISPSSLRGGGGGGQRYSTSSATAGSKRNVRTKSIVLLEDFFQTFQKRSSTSAPAPSADAAPAEVGTSAPPASLAQYEFGNQSVLSDPLSASTSSHGNTTDGPHSLLRRAIVNYRDEIEDCMKKTVAKMSESLRPFTFEQFLDACRHASDVLNEGDPDCNIRLCIMKPEEPTLVGAESVMMYVKKNIFEKAQEFGSTVYAAEWVFRYTTAFLNAQIAMTEADAILREEIVAECVQFLADINTFTETVLSLGSKSRHYEEFNQLQHWMEQQADALIEPLERRFKAILTRCPFPEQRAVFKKHYRKLEAMAAAAAKFVAAFDMQWSSTIPYHERWKEDFLNRCYERLHGNVANAWMTASLGFVDPSLHLLVKTESSNSKQPQEFRKRIPMSLRIAQMIVNENATFYQIALATKGVASSVVGLQLAMGARYCLEEASKEYDAKWGFTMSEGSLKDQQRSLSQSSLNNSPAVAKPSASNWGGSGQSPSTSSVGALGGNDGTSSTFTPVVSPQSPAPIGKTMRSPFS